MEVTEAAAAFWGDLFAGLRPPPELTVDQWADRYLLHAGGDAGVFAFASVPAGCLG
jgi:hypothetical protein